MAEPALDLTHIQSRDIDLVHLARQTAGDRLLEREVLAMFRDQCVRQLRVIREWGATRQGRDAAHTLTGAARGVGAFRIAEIAAKLEAADQGAFQASIEELQAAAHDAQALVMRLLSHD